MEKCFFLAEPSVNICSTSSTCCRIALAYRRNTPPSGVSSIPWALRSKIATPRLFSSSLMARLRLDWPTNKRSAALLMEPVSATATAYFMC